MIQHLRNEHARISSLLEAPALTLGYCPVLCLRYNTTATTRPHTSMAEMTVKITVAARYGGSSAMASLTTSLAPDRTSKGASQRCSETWWWNQEARRSAGKRFSSSCRARSPFFTWRRGEGAREAS